VGWNAPALPARPKDRRGDGPIGGGCQLAGGETSAIILDLHLGQENGFDLLREIRSSQEIRSSSDVPVVISDRSFPR
jgi:hypothetical protein